jgi:hypothetical protein
MVPLIEANEATRVFSVDMSAGITDDLDNIEPAARSWRAPSLITLAGTTLGAYVSASERARPKPLPLERHYDAILYLGPQAAMTQSKLPLDLVSDPAYQHMRMIRTTLALLPP